MHRVAMGIVAVAAGAGLYCGAWGQTPGAASPIAGGASFHSTHRSVRHLHRRRGQTRSGAHSQGHAPVPGAAGLEPAPVPDQTAAPPAADSPGSTGAAVNPGELQMHYPPLGEGFLPGSSHAAVDNLTTPKVPGVIVTVPVGNSTVPP